MQIKHKKVGVFGGSFNPIHRGHINSALSIKQQFNLDKIILVPSYQSPGKMFIHTPTPEQRLAMVKLTTENNPNDFEVFDFEVNNKRLSYTIDTIKQMAAREPEEIYLIIGLDQFLHFHQWKDFAEILENAHLVVTSRPDYKWPTSVELWPKPLQSLVKTTESPNVFEILTGKRVYFVQLEDVKISATDIRKRLHLGKTADRFLSAEILQFIQDENLYQPSDTKIPDFEEFARFCATFMSSTKAIDVNAVDLRGLDMPTDFALIASGTSTKHSMSLCEKLLEAVRNQYGVSPLAVEGKDFGRWIVVDYGSLIVHVFYNFTREEYHLEELWAEGKELTFNRINQ